MLPELAAPGGKLLPPRFVGPGFYGLDVVQPEAHHFAEAVMVAHQILPTVLGAGPDVQGQDPMEHLLAPAPGAEIDDAHAALIADGFQQRKHHLGIQRPQEVMVLEPEPVRRGIQLVQQEGTHHAQRVRLREKGQGIAPAAEVDGAVVSAVNHLPAPLFAAQQPQLGVFLQLFADDGDVRLEGVFKMAQVVRQQTVQNLSGGHGAVTEQIQHIEVEHHIPVREAFGFECIVEGVGGDGPAVHAEEDPLAVAAAAEAHVVAQPALHPAALVVVAAWACGIVFPAAAEAVDIKLPHIFPDAAEILNQLAVCHCAPLLMTK